MSKSESVTSEVASFDLIKLKQSVIGGEIYWRDAQALVRAYTGKKRPWQTKEWRTKRAELISDRCAGCGTDKAPFVLQHTWHPPNLFTLKKRLRHKLHNEWRAWNEEYPKSRAYDREFIAWTGKTTRELLAAWYEAFDERYGINRDAFIQWLDGHIRYMACEDTVTLCRRCAFVADKTNLILCSVCKSNYHAPRFNRCSRCAGLREEDQHETHHNA